MRANNAPLIESKGFFLIQVEGAKKGRNRSKITLIRTLKNNMSMKEVIENITLDKIEWRQGKYT